jgi:hypothetical protein
MVLHSSNTSIQEAEAGGWRFKDSPGKQLQERVEVGNPSQQRAGGAAQGAGPEFKAQYQKKKKKKIPDNLGYIVRLFLK